VISGIGGRLAAAGMTRAACEAKARLFESASHALALPGGQTGPPALALFVPGRIEVLGKHTDYAGGRSLLCAVERGFCLVACPRADRRVRIADAATGEDASFDLNPDLAVNEGHWAAYPMTVARRVARNFPGARAGADISFISDLPPASGMSSSSALLTAVFLALSALNGLESDGGFRRDVRSPEDLAGYLGTVENGQSFGSLEGDRGVGTFGGSEDHTAMLCCRAGRLSQYSFCPVRHEREIPLPDDLTFVVGVSGVVAEKTGAARDRCNRVSAAAQIVLGCGAPPRAARRPLADAAGSSPDAPDRIRAVLAGRRMPFPPAMLLARFNQFLAKRRHPGRRRRAGWRRPRCGGSARGSIATRGRAVAGKPGTRDGDAGAVRA
jgi:galactokinase